MNVCEGMDQIYLTTMFECWVQGLSLGYLKFMTCLLMNVCERMDQIYLTTIFECWVQPLNLPNKSLTYACLREQLKVKKMLKPSSVRGRLRGNNDNTYGTKLLITFSIFAQKLHQNNNSSV